MKIITRAVLDWDGNVLEEDSYEYEGPVARAKDSGSPPQATDPYEQAAAQYQLSTGTANYNAALNRTSSVNPLGSDTWAVTGQDTGGYNPSSPSSGTTATTTPGSTPSAGSTSSGQPIAYFGGSPIYGGSYPAGAGVTTGGGAGIGYPAASSGTGAPLYTETTSLSPQFNSMIQEPINDYNIVGDQGVGAAAQQAEEAAYNEQMGYLEPQQQQESETQQAQLANSGVMPGSAAYDYETQNLGRQQTFAKQQAANAAVGAGQTSLSNMANIGSAELQNELAARNAPISEYNALKTGSGAGVSASTPDISGAFSQQLQSELGGYNANVASNNADTSAAGSVLASYLMYLALA